MALGGSQLLSAAGPQLVGTPTVTYVSYSYVRLAWQTNVASTDIVLYGVSNAYGKITPPPGDYYVPNYGSATQHSWFISGLAPATTFHYCIQSTDASGVSSTCDGVTNDFTFTTPAAPVPSPQAPEAPRATVDITEPVQTGRTLTVSAANNCSDPSTGLQATLNTAVLGDTIVIPHGTVCDGVYTFPPKTSGSGWIVVKSDGSLPPAGTRITPANKSQMATIRTSRPAIWYYNASYIPSAPCYGGTLIQEIESRGLHPGLHTCIASQNRFSAELPYITGTTVPASCTEGNIFYNTATAAALPYNSTYQCVNDNGTTHYVPLDQNYDGPYELTAGIQFADGAHHYRLEGLEVTFPPVPSTYAAMGGGIYYGSLINMPDASHDIILDRLYVHGQDYPAEGPNSAIYFEGSRQALINSYVDNIAYWMPQTTPNPEHYTSAIIIEDGPGPGRIQNNYLSAVGITLYVSESNYTESTVPSDYQLFGNYFYKDDKYRLGSPTNISLMGGRGYGNRHLLEFKEGHRWSVQGNVFDGNFSFINQGASIAITGTPADRGANVNNDMQVSDVSFTNNIFKNSPQGFVIAGTYAITSANGPSTPSPKTVSRIKIDNNLFYQLDSSLVTNPPYSLARGNAIPLTLGYGAEDLRYSHNTSICNSRQDGPIASFFSAPLTGVGLLMNDNVACFGVNSSQAGVTGEGSIGTTALNANWQTYPNTFTAWQFNHNVIYGDPTPGYQPVLGWAYPTGNFWPANDTSVGFNNAASLDFGLTSTSPYRGQASDGTDPGVDMVRLSAATASTVSGVNYVAPATLAPVISGIAVTAVTQTGATVTWNTDVKSDSQVEFGLTTSYGSFSTWNPALAFTHSVALSNLTLGTTYHYRVKSTDGAGNMAVSPDQTFTTASSGATVTGVTSATANGTYGSNAAITLSVAFSKTMTVTGVPQLSLNSGGVARYASGSGTTVLSFVYTVAAGQSSSRLDYSSTGALSLNGGTIVDSGAVAATLTLNAPSSAGSLGANANLVIDTAPPAVVSYTVLFGSQSYNLTTSTRNRLPWGITGVRVVFSKAIKTGTLRSLSGVTATAFSGLNTTTLTWTFDPLVLGKYTTVLTGTGADALKDSLGNAVGNGAGVSQLMKVLLGDFNDDGMVNSQDQVLINSARSGAYNLFADLNGDNAVNNTDVTIVRNRIGTSLP